MSLPHQCECRICGRSMNEAPGAAFQFPPLFAGMDVAQGQSRSGWMCTKHGVIQGPDCEQCRADSALPVGDGNG